MVIGSFLKIHDLTSHIDLASFTVPDMIPFCEVVFEFTLTAVSFKIQMPLLHLYISIAMMVTSAVHGLHSWKGFSIAFLSLLLAYSTFWCCKSHQREEYWVSSDSNFKIS